MPSVDRNRKVVFTNNEYVWRNATAKVYYNALAFNPSLVYGVAENIYKAALDQFFVTGNTDGWLAKRNAIYLTQGLTNASQRINAKTPGTFDLDIINSPSYGINGFTLDGATQYAKTGIIPSTHLTANNIGLDAHIVGATNGTNKAIWGVFQSNNQRLDLGYVVVGDIFAFDAYNSATRVSYPVGFNNGFYGVNQRTTIDKEIYLNGVSQGNGVLTGGTIPTIELYLGAYNSNGTAGSFINGTISFASSGLGLNDAESLSIYNAYVTFATVIGRTI